MTQVMAKSGINLQSRGVYSVDITFLTLILLKRIHLKTKFTQDHCGDGGFVLTFVHSCKPDASLHIYRSVGRPL